MPVLPHVDRERLRNLVYLSKPKLWPVWPFLPLMRRRLCGRLYC